MERKVRQTELLVQAAAAHKVEALEQWASKDSTVDQMRAPEQVPAAVDQAQLVELAQQVALAPRTALQAVL